jgi:outer membrane protein assembly factor BamB
VSPDGSTVFVTGESGGAVTSADYATIAYDGSTGRKLWIRRYDGPGNDGDASLAIAVTSDGSKVFVTGESQRSTTVSSLDYATLAYDASTGARLWTKRYDGPG